jgi:hypothetical protein
MRRRGDGTRRWRRRCEHQDERGQTNEADDERGAEIDPELRQRLAPRVTARITERRQHGVGARRLRRVRTFGLACGSAKCVEDQAHCVSVVDDVA